MGRATIVQHVAGGLYRVRLDWDMRTIEAERSALAEESARYAEIVNKATRTRDRLAKARDDARVGMEAVIQQWIDAVITATEEEPPNLSGEGGTPPEEAQESALFSAINTARGLDLERDEALDTAIGVLLQVLANTGRTTDINSTPERRASLAGYAYNPEIGVEIVTQFGATSAADALARMRATPANAAVLDAAKYTECGVGYHYAPNNRYSYLWGVILAAAGTDVDINPSKDPATEDAKSASEELDRVTVPRLDTFQPKKLGEVCASFGRAVAEHRAAENAVESLRLGQAARLLRLATLEAILAQTSEVVHVWACQYVDDLPVGAIVWTAEVPGALDYRPVSRVFETNGVQYEYQERAINLVPTGDSGRLRKAEGLPAAMVFFDLAMEPGHLRWRPLWRYGVITTIDPGPICGVQLAVVEARTASGLGSDLSLNQAITLASVPIDAACPALFVVGDEVIVWFKDADWSKPVILGWRRILVITQ